MTNTTKTKTPRKHTEAELPPFKAARLGKRKRKVTSYSQSGIDALSDMIMVAFK